MPSKTGSEPLSLGPAGGPTAALKATWLFSLEPLLQESRGHWCALLACWLQSCKQASAALRGLPHARGPALPLAYLFFVLDGLLSFVTLLCELEFVVHSAAREHLGLLKCGLYK